MSRIMSFSVATPSPSAPALKGGDLPFLITFSVPVTAPPRSQQSTNGHSAEASLGCVVLELAVERGLAYAQQSCGLQLVAMEL
jgi:hypothetical protein